MMLKALQQTTILAMIAGSRPWKRLLTLSLMVFVAVITPVALSSCQPVNIESPPQLQVVTRALTDTADPKPPIEESVSSPIGHGGRAAPTSPMVASDPNNFAIQQQPESAPSPPFETGGDGADSDASQLLNPVFIADYNTLVEGEFFHTIPPYMNAGQQLVIRAGVSEEVNQRLLTSLGLTGTEPVTIIGNGRFNPLQMELTLDGAENEFVIEPISDGIKSVIRDFPETWEWIVTPRKSGSFPLKLLALVQLKADQQGGSQQQELVLFSDAIQIRPVAGYTWNQILRRYLSQDASLLGFLILCGFIGWLMSRKISISSRGQS